MENFTAFISSLSAAIVALSSLIIVLIQKKKEISDNLSVKVKKQNAIDNLIMDKLEEVKEFLKADRVQIYDFHNGEHYANGRSALKVSCTYEVIRAGIKSYRNQLQSIPLSCIPKFINRLLNKQEMVINDLEEIKDIMPGTYNLKKEQEVKSFYDVVVKNKEKEPIGFLAIQYVNDNKKNYTADEKDEILKLKFFIEEHLEELRTKNKK